MLTDKVILNHWVEGAIETQEKLIYLAHEIQVYAASTGDYSLIDPFKNIQIKAFSQNSFIDAVDEELAELTKLRLSKDKNQFNNLTSITKAAISERVALAFLSGRNHDQVTSELDAIIAQDVRYFDLIFGVSYEYQKRALLKAKKLGYNSWVRHADQIEDFINDKIRLRDIKKPKSTPGERTPRGVAGKTTSGYPSSLLENRLSYLGFLCKEHVTKGQLESFHKCMVKSGYFKECDPTIKIIKNAALKGGYIPQMWLTGIGTLVFVFTILAEEIFELPEDIYLPPYPLQKMEGLEKKDQALRTKQLKNFSRWLNSNLVMSIRNSEGLPLTTDQLVAGRKNKKKENYVGWLHEFEELMDNFSVPA